MLKLDDLKKLEITILNKIVGGDNWMGMDPDDAFSTLGCGGNCHGVFYPDGSHTITGDSMTMD